MSLHAFPATAFRKNLIRTLAAPLILLLLIPALLSVLIIRLDRSNRAVESTSTTITQAHLVQKLLLDMETAVRGYLLSGDSIFLQPYQLARVRFPEELQTLKQELPFEPKIDEVNQRAQEWLRWSQEILTANPPSIPRNAPISSSVIASLQQRKVLMDSIRETLSELVAELELTRATRFSANQNQLSTTVASVALMSLLLIAILATSVRSHLRFLVRNYDRALDQVESSKRTLEERVKERTTELQAANKELEAFSYSVSHDLRAPLRAMDGFSQAVLKEYSDLIDDRGRDYLRRISAASKRMGSLIDDLLSLSRVGRGEISRQQVELSQMAKQITDELKSSEPQRKAVVLIEEGLTADTDPALSRVVLNNLLDNAWKYTSKKDEAHIFFSAKHDAEGHTIYCVRDDGCGFNMRYADKLFGPFQRLHSTTDFPGNGIGLATVRRAVHRMGGEVWAQSEPGHGTTFYFTLGFNGKKENADHEPQNGHRDHTAR